MLRSEILDLVQRASERKAAEVRLHMRRGLTSLATIASVAPFIGVLGTVLGIVNSFPGMEGEKSALLAIVNWRLSESLVPTVLALLVAVPAHCFYIWFTDRTTSTLK